jgi:hypothetical protein
MKKNFKATEFVAKATLIININPGTHDVVQDSSGTIYIPIWNMPTMEVPTKTKEEPQEVDEVEVDEVEETTTESEEAYTLKELKEMSAADLKEIVVEEFEQDLKELAKELKVKRWSVASLSTAIMGLQDDVEEDDVEEEEVEAKPKGKKSSRLVKKIEKILTAYNDEDDYEYEDMVSEVLELISEKHTHKSIEDYIESYVEDEEAEMIDGANMIEMLSLNEEPKVTKAGDKKSRRKSGKKKLDIVAEDDWDEELQTDVEVMVEFKDTQEAQKGIVINKLHKKYDKKLFEEGDIVILFDDESVDYLDADVHSKVSKVPGTGLPF